MKLRRRLSETRAARARVVAANTRVGASMYSVRSWTRARPLLCVAAATASGWALGRWVNHPWGISSLIRLASTQVVPWVSHLMAMARDPD